MRIALLVVAGLALIGFVFVAFVLPQMSESEAKEAAQVLVAGAEPAKQQVTAAAEKAGNLAGAGKNVKVAARNDAKSGELKWLIAENGSIRGWNEKNAIEITLIPALQGGKVSWTCRGYPVSVMPVNCGGRS
jgi:hypothetical protein